MLDRQNIWLTGSIFADPDHLSEGVSHGKAPPCYDKCTQEDNEANLQSYHLLGFNRCQQSTENLIK